MLNELKILFDNVKNFRKLSLNEAYDGRFVDAINKHKVVQIYYNGDKTVLKGYRTIRPFVIGKYKKTGEMVLRAWQDEGSSDSLNKKYGVKPRSGHEKFNNPKSTEREKKFNKEITHSKIVPGWRLFKLKDITSFLPTGVGFDPSKYFKVDGVDYNPNDKDMDSILASIKMTSTVGNDFDAKSNNDTGFDKPTDIDREITKDEVIELANYVKKHYKKSIRNYWIAKNDRDDMMIKTRNQVYDEKIPKTHLIGNLNDLYRKYVLGDVKDDKSFYNKEIKDTFSG